MRLLANIFFLIGLGVIALVILAWIDGGTFLFALGLDARIIRQGGLVAALIAAASALGCFFNAGVLFGLADVRDNTAHLKQLAERYRNNGLASNKESLDD